MKDINYTIWEDILVLRISNNNWEKINNMNHNETWNSRRYDRDTTIEKKLNHKISPWQKNYMLGIRRKKGRRDH